MPFLSQLRLRFFLGAYRCKTRAHVLSLVDSTNLRLKEQARSGSLSAPFLLMAHAQSAGRGRLGRAFVSPRGTGLYMSLLVRPKPNTPPGKITLLAAVSVCKALEEFTSLQPKIKWVNDIFIRGHKVCGILAEGIGDQAVVGIGVNIKTPPGGFPKEAGIAGALDMKVSREKLCARIAFHFLSGMEQIDDPAILREYRLRMPLIGREISFSENGQEKNAHVTGVDEDGALLIETEEGPSSLRCGEVSLGSHSFLGLE